MIGSLTVGAAWDSIATGATVGLLLGCAWLAIRAVVRVTGGRASDRSRRACPCPDCGCPVRAAKNGGAVTIGTCLKIDDHADVRVIVGAYSVEVSCAGTEIDMNDECLAEFVAVAEQALPQLATHAHPAPTTTAARITVDTSAGQCFRTPASTWVVCDADSRLRHSIKGGVVELRWGDLVWTISRAALSRLLDRARRAQAVLAERMSQLGEPAPDQEIPELHPVSTG